jgi:nitrous oxidase accessory protein NosD
MKMKALVVGIVLMVVGAGIIPAVAQDTEKSLPASRGNWLYVGGSGPGNYTRIQDAIDDSSNGDTVFVYDDSSPYHENLIIDKSIMLYAEDRDTTVLAGVNGTITINITAASVYVSGFTIKQTTSGLFGVAIHADSIWIESNRFIGEKPKPHTVNNGITAQGVNNLTIINNEFKENVTAINIIKSNSSMIKKNSITGGWYAVKLDTCYDTIIANNRINESINCITIYGGNHSIISNNTINLGKITGEWWRLLHINVSSEYGIYFYQSNVIVTDNLINDCQKGIISYGAESCYIARNEITQCYCGLLSGMTRQCTFINNDFHQNVLKQISESCFMNHYTHNYWGRPRLLPKPLINFFLFPIGHGWYPINILIPIPTLEFRPALLPNI